MTIVSTEVRRPNGAEGDGVPGPSTLLALGLIPRLLADQNGGPRGPGFTAFFQVLAEPGRRSVGLLGSNIRADDTIPTGEHRL